jgi:hypothetical protein
MGLTLDEDTTMASIAATRYGSATYSDRVTLLHIPIGVLALLIGRLILFFVSIIGGLLVEQQGEQIAFLRSRGALCKQLVGALSAHREYYGSATTYTSRPLVLATYIPSGDQHSARIQLACPA